jgi:hypothetical protein
MYILNVMAGLVLLKNKKTPLFQFQNTILECVNDVIYSQNGVTLSETNGLNFVL